MFFPTQDSWWQHCRDSGTGKMQYSLRVDYGKLHRKVTLTLYFEALPRDTAPRASVRILGLQLGLSLAWHKKPPLNIDTLIQQIRKKSPPRLADDKIVILLVDFNGRKTLQALMEQFRLSLSNLQIEEHRYLFSYETVETFPMAKGRSESTRIVAVHPVTSAPTGTISSVLVAGHMHVSLRLL